MRVAVVGSRSLMVKDVGEYLPAGTTEIISGGAKGVDASARRWAKQQGMPMMEYLPDYRRWGRGAPLRRNDEILARADYAVIFWDGISRGTAYMIRCCMEERIPFRLICFRASK